MKPSPPNRVMDRLSDLPDDILLRILSFLPTKRAARTSLLSRRFRHLWKTCPTLEIDVTDFRFLRCSDFVRLTEGTIRHRNKNPLHRLFFHYSDRFCDGRLRSSYIASLIAKAASLGLRHLVLKLGHEILASVLPVILSLGSLESLSLDPVGGSCEKYIMSSSIGLTHLKTLSIYVDHVADDVLNWLISQLHALEDLDLTCLPYLGYLDLKLVTIKRLKLVISCCYMKISTPSLEFFEINCTSFRHFKWEMPMLKTATIQFSHVFSVHATCQMLMAVSNVEELHLDIEENMARNNPIHALVVNSLDVPIFSSLKHLNLEICFHDCNIEGLVTLLQHSPALESLKLVHKPPIGHMREKELWRSMLPQNADRAYFEDLHIAEKKEELLRKLNRKESSKRLKT